jgi:nicotinamidase-related amidase
MDQQTALLIIDIQNDYFEGGTNPLVGSLEASLNAKKILVFFRKNHLKIFHVQHIAARPGSTFFLPGSRGAEIHTHVEPLAGEELVVKHFPNSFHGTDLHASLIVNNITNIVVCGMMTHMCVDASIRAAKDLGFNCTVISDACATKNLEIQGEQVKAKDVHYAFLAALGYFYANIQTTFEFLNENK